MPISASPARKAAPRQSVHWLDEADPSALSRAGRRDVVVFSKADAYRAAFSYAVANPPRARSVRLPRVLVTMSLGSRERAAFETASDVVVDRSIARMLPARELHEALEAENRADLFVAASVAEGAGVVTLYRGTLDPLVVPADWFRGTGEASKLAPDLAALTPIDFGQTLRLGEVEVSADAVLYEFDADYRRRAKARLRREDGVGASVRRLRNQRGLNQETVAEAAGLSRRGLGRIERGEVEAPRPATVAKLASILGTTSDELGWF